MHIVECKNRFTFLLCFPPLSFSLFICSVSYFNLFLTSYDYCTTCTCTCTCQFVSIDVKLHLLCIALFCPSIAEFGDYDEAIHTSEFFDDHILFPSVSELVTCRAHYTHFV